MKKYFGIIDVYCSTLLFFIIAIPLYTVFHELGHFIVGNFIYHYNGHMVFAPMFLSGAYVSDRPLSFICSFAGGFTSAIVFIIPFLVFKNVFIKVISFFIIVYGIVNAISEAFYWNWYLESSYLYVSAIVTILVSLAILISLNIKSHYFEKYVLQQWRVYENN
jgi:hypothetical protein